MINFTRNKFWFAGMLAFLALGLSLLYEGSSESYSAAGSDNQKAEAVETIPEGPYARIGKINIPVEIARTDEEVKKGLSGRVSLDTGSGMLFVFAKPDIYRFWMPNMRFPLDIIWIDGGKVVFINENVPADFDPANPVFYSPPRPVRYALEVNAGFSKKKNIRTGDAVIFNYFSE